ncbi:MAG: amidohydrolase family protein [Candidatus Obscuribacterales bacterium]|nr:amidohydrolase family protein [Candidatus Obscuribacterales bacterium]
MGIDLKTFVFLDQHCHPLRKRQQQLDLLDFRKSFSESRSITQIEEHMPTSVFYMDLLNRLGDLFEVYGEKEVFAKRQSLPEKEYLNRLWDNVSIGGMIVDDGYVTGDSMSIEEMSAISQRPVWRCLRLEQILEAALGKASSFHEVLSLFKTTLEQAKSTNAVGVKTIAGYRGGLDLQAVPVEAARKEYDGLKTRSGIRIGGPDTKNLYHYALLEAFEIAGSLNLPVQLHTGIGDDDGDLRQTNPLVLRDVFISERFNKTQFVLLHCYPYVSEAAYFCSIYPNVYMDLSLSISFASPYARYLLRQALSMAPTSKILAASDGHTVPEAHWYGALSWKRVLSIALNALISAGLIYEEQAHDIAAAILHENAKKLYNLEGLA